MREERLEVSVTFDERGYIGSAPELRQSVVALSLGGLRRKIEIAMCSRSRTIENYCIKSERRQRLARTCCWLIFGLIQLTANRCQRRLCRDNFYSFPAKGSPTVKGR